MRTRNRKAKESREDRKPRSPSAKQDRVEKTLSRLTHEVRLPRKPDQTQKTTPPKFGQKVLYFFLSRKEEHKIGDLTEHYRIIKPKLGRRAAYVWYYKEVMMLLLKRLPKIIWSAFYTLFDQFFNRHVK